MAMSLTGCLGWFSQFSTTDASSLSGISCPSSSTCFAVGSNSTGNAFVEQTTDDGGHWTADTDGVTGLGLNAISCADPVHCVAVGGVSLGGIISPSNSVLVTTTGGQTWEASTIPSVDGYLTSVSCPDVEHCWATAAVGIVGVSTVAATTNGGVSWTVLRWSAPPPPANESGLMSSQLDAVACTTTLHCVVVGEAMYQTAFPQSSENQGVISTTSDGGQTWQSQLVSAPVVTGISCPNTQDCVAVGQDSSYQVSSADGGATWTVSTLASGTQIVAGNAPLINAISCSGTLRCIAVGEYVPSENATYETPVLATADGGTTWSSQASNPNDVDLQAVTCVTSSSCWAVGFTAKGSVVIHTVTGGVASPAVSAVTPAQGPAGGGESVTVTGTGFSAGVSSVHFGAVVATSVAVISDSELTVAVPRSTGLVLSSPDVVDVTITTLIGTSPDSPGDQFTYLGGPALTVTTTAPGASCNNTNPQLPVCTGLASGDAMTVSGSGFAPGAIAAIAQCNGDPRQPVVLFLDQHVPVSCSRLALVTIPISGPHMGDLSERETIAMGTVGPPVTGLVPTCTEGSTSIPGCATSGNAAVDAANYPCPPTPAQQAGGDTCVLAVSDTAGDHAVGIMLTGVEQLPGT
jgi:hypothetical protein